MRWGCDAAYKGGFGLYRAFRDNMAERLWVRIRGRANKADGVASVYWRSSIQDDYINALFYK